MTQPAARPAHRGPVRIVAGLTEAVFTWHDDRWAHEVRLPGGLVWRSLEGPAEPGADARWPASPALVEVSLVAAGARQAILGVGLAGRCHFSLCVTPHPEQTDTLLFEAACRIADARTEEPRGWLGSMYAGPDGRTAGIAAATGGVVTRLPTTMRWNYTVGPAGIGGVPLAPEALVGPAAGR
jgi:hypothetical protein